MKTKMVEIRDDGTRILALAIKTEGETPQEKEFFYYCGFGKDSVMLIRPEDPLISYDPYAWNTPGDTMKVAHRYIQRHFDELSDDGAVIDVRVIEGKRTEPAASEVWR
jgi:hypothetical protein